MESSQSGFKGFEPEFWRLIGMVLMGGVGSISLNLAHGPHFIQVGPPSAAYIFMEIVFYPWVALSFFYGFWMFWSGKVSHRMSLVCLVGLVIVIVLDAMSSGQPPRPALLVTIGPLAATEFMFGMGALIHGTWRQRRHTA